MNVLLVNDDGLHAKGIWYAFEAIKTFAENIYIVVPAKGRLAASHSTSLDSPLRFERLDWQHKDENVEVIIVDGSPVDCIKLTLSGRLVPNIDLVVSGVNHGPNLGIDILYSGTCAAAVEAALQGVSAVAISLASEAKEGFIVAREFIAKRLLEIVDVANKIKNPCLLNINVPDVKLHREPKLSSNVNPALVRQANSRYAEHYEVRIDPRGREYRWLCGSKIDFGEEKDTDFSIIKRGFISITPLTWDLTDEYMLKCMQKIFCEQISENKQKFSAVGTD